MKKTLPVLVFAAFTSLLVAQDLPRWQAQARRITLTRDDWGIAHVHGRTDADAVFGMVYAQAEDDFNRIETNFLNSQGRLAEAEGERALLSDLRMQLFIQPAALQAQYERSPRWLKQLMDAWADGLNFFLASHPLVKPRVITRFEPWMALSFSEGSIGGDIETISLEKLAAFYGSPRTVPVAETRPSRVPLEPGGSNGFAIAPSNSSSHHALLWINPHTSFFFRSELQVTSDQGLNAYGAVTWGQFFVYQGFNERVGWMHTSSNADTIDEYLETIQPKDGKLFYRYGQELRPVLTTTLTIPYKTEKGIARRAFTIYRTHHGPIVRADGDRWVAVRLMEEPVKALTQSFSRTKARTYKAFRRSMELHTNSSNNTIFADADGDIAYFHANFIPKRDPQFDFTKPVDGSDPRTEWGTPHSVEESPFLLNPASGWLYNTNNWPFTAAGAASPKRENYPRYMESGAENPRGVHAIRLLSAKKDFTPDTLIAAAFDPYLPEFAVLVPTLITAYDNAPMADPLKASLAEPLQALRAWDFTWSANSVPTSLAVYWGEELLRQGVGSVRTPNATVYDLLEHRLTADQRLHALDDAVNRLTADFGTWRTPWGDINRFQRRTGDLVQPFSDAEPSLPVPFPSAWWGSLASFGARAYPHTKKRYGTSGNSFLAVVEFGKRVRAKAISAGGESGDPHSTHFNDQAERYAKGELREVYFYPSQLKGHTERAYHPGQ